MNHDFILEIFETDIIPKNVYVQNVVCACDFFRLIWASAEKDIIIRHKTYQKCNEFSFWRSHISWIEHGIRVHFIKKKRNRWFIRCHWGLERKTRLCIYTAFSTLYYSVTQRIRWILNQILGAYFTPLFTFFFVSILWFYDIQIQRFLVACTVLKWFYWRVCFSHFW